MTPNNDTGLLLPRGRLSFIELMRRQFPKSAPRRRQLGIMTLNGLNGFWAPAPPTPAFLVDAAKFDETTGSGVLLQRTTNLTGAADSKIGLMSCWINLPTLAFAFAGGSVASVTGAGNEQYFSLS